MLVLKRFGSSLHMVTYSCRSPVLCTVIILLVLSLRSFVATSSLISSKEAVQPELDGKAPAGNRLLLTDTATKSAEQHQELAFNFAYDMPYKLQELVDLPALLDAHKQYQIGALAAGNGHAPAVICTTNEFSGLGNRVPGVITSFAIALITGRVWLLQSTLLEYIDFPFPLDWSQYSHLYVGVPSCDIDHFTRLVSPTLQFCGAPGQNHNAPVWKFTHRWDYDLPMLQINSVLRPFFDKFFPKGDVFHQLSTYLMKNFKQSTVEHMEPYVRLAKKCDVGMHMRTKKPGTSARVRQFASIAKALASTGDGGTIFLAADANVFGAMQALLPRHNLWWSKLTETGLNTTTQAGNPATELSAFVDFALISQCKQIILTPASSLGAIAAGYAGVSPIYAFHGHHKDPFHNPWFGMAITSEPCFYKSAVVHRVNTSIARQFRELHPLWMHHNQCHFDTKVIGWPPPDWECEYGQACRED